MTTCRVCDRAGATSLPIGVYAPFFSLRVDTSKDEFALYSSGGVLPQPNRSLVARARHRMLRRLAGLGAARMRSILRTSCNFCIACESLTLSHEYGYESLSALYVDYRAESYNRDRISVEPEYAALAARIGADPAERTSRNNGVARFLEPFLPQQPVSRALDLGGSDGRFIPREVIGRFQQTHVFDTSDAQVDPEVTALAVRKVTSAAAGSYGLLMCMHVLEHVGSPRAFVWDSLRYLSSGGLLYLEVPLELNAGTAAQFVSRTVDRCVTIHEHINQYGERSIPALIRSIDRLELLASESASVDCGWTTARVGRYLARCVD